jgi:hypothetical protein
VLLPGVPSSSSPRKGLYNPKAFVTHAALLGQACAHCPKFLTAASRRSLGRLSVPVWLAVLSDQLPIVALVGRHPANQLIGRGPLPGRHLAMALPRAPKHGLHAVLAALSGGYPPPGGRSPTRSSAVRHWVAEATPSDLHVLGTPPAFILSQDQTLHQNASEGGPKPTPISCPRGHRPR